MKIYVLSASDGWESSVCGYYNTEEIAKEWKLFFESDKGGDPYDKYYISERELIDTSPNFCLLLDVED